MITKEMTILEVVSMHPEAVKIFAKHGLGCVGCHAAQFENIEQGAIVHGINVPDLLKDLNDLISKGTG